MTGHVKHKYICNPGYMTLYCKHGHRLLGDNLYVYPDNAIRVGKRVCKTCRGVSLLKYYHKPETKVIRMEKRPGLEHNRAWRYWQMILDAYGAFCYCCRETEIEFLTLDHIKQDGCAHRTRRPSMAAIYLDVIREGYPRDKYRIACMQCNWATRRGRICPHKKVREDAIALAGAC